MKVVFHIKISTAISILLSEYSRYIGKLYWCSTVKFFFAIIMLSRAGFTNRLYRLKPRDSSSKGPPGSCGPHRVNCRYV